MRRTIVSLLLTAVCSAAFALPQSWQPSLTRQQTYTPHLASSHDPARANNDFRVIAPGATLTVLDVNGPGEIAHIWFTMDDEEPYALKKVVLRMYWDNETDPSVQAPIGDFFGLGLGLYHSWSSEMLSVGNSKALNSFFPMPFEKHARITITNQGKEPVSYFYYNINYRTYDHPLPKDTLYFHAEYRQAQPNHGWTDDWTTNEDPQVNNKPDYDGKGNYVFLTAKGHGQFVGVTMSILQNQDRWWGEGNPMFFIDGSKTPTMEGTGSDDFFRGAWDFGNYSNSRSVAFDYPLYGAPIVGPELAGSRTSVYRFFLAQPIPFHTSFKLSIEHGNANHRSDNFYSVAYWYQANPHAPLPALPPVQDRLPTLEPTGGPGNAGMGVPGGPHVKAN